MHVLRSMCWDHMVQCEGVRPGGGALFRFGCRFAVSSAVSSAVSFGREETGQVKEEDERALRK